MKLLNDEVRTMLTEILSDMVDDVNVKLFVDTLECSTCTESNQLLEEIQALNDKVKYELVQTNGDKSVGSIYGVTQYPTYVFLDKEMIDTGIRFMGIPAGHEINALLSALLDVSGKQLDLTEAEIAEIKQIDKETNIKVFVTLACPHCSGAVQKAHRIAMLNPYVKAEMVEAQTFTNLSMKHNVSSVPKIVINDTQEFVGNQPLATFLETIAQA